MIRTNAGYYNNTANPQGEVNCPPDPERVAKGLRDTGYNFNTAVADVIDNSIAAGATRVDIKIDMNPGGDIKIYIADNGSGMDAYELQNAMKYGSDRRKDEGSLGKFGLGLKTASTAFCRCLSVVTRGRDNVTRKAQWDLDYIAETHAWTLKMPTVSRDEENLLFQTAKGGSGTLVIWEKVDRLLKSTYKNLSSKKTALTKKIAGLRFHIAMVYQRFLDVNDTRGNNIVITLNGEKVEAWDPFVTNNALTELLADDSVDVDLPDGSSASFTLRAFMLPTKNSFNTAEERNNAKITNDMQGFYVYRENRLIDYGDWLGLFANDIHYSLLRIEFSFDHRLDEAFSVDIKKSHIFPAEEIMNYIKNEFIAAPRRAAEERHRHGITNAVVNEAKGKEAHVESNKNIEQKAEAVEGAKITVTKPDEIKIENQNGTFTHKITIVNHPDPKQVRVIPVQNLENGELWKPCISDGKHAVMINQSHPYYQKVYAPVLSQNNTVTGMDSLIWALAESEHTTYNDSMKDQYEEMRISVSRILKTLVEDLPEPEV